MGYPGHMAIDWQCSESEGKLCTAVGGKKGLVPVRRVGGVLGHVAQAHIWAYLAKVAAVRLKNRTQGGTNIVAGNGDSTSSALLILH